MFSARYEDLSFELGGELIDTNHVTMHALAEELNIKLDDVTADYPSDSEFRAEIFWLTGQEISHATLLEQLGSFADVVRAANRVEEGPAFSAIDAMSISQWLEVHRTPNPLKQVLEAAYTMEFGIPADKQTAFNLIWMLGKDPQFSSAAAGQRVSEFQIFGASDERYRAHEGNQSFTDALLQRVGGTRSIRYGNRLIAIKRDSGGSLRLVFATAGGTREHSYERVVVAIPFSVLREVDLTALALDKHLTLEGTGPDKQTVIDTLGYGTNAKVMMFFREPVWRTRHNSSGVAITDDLLEEIWDTTRGQRSKLCVLTNFTGGADGGRSSGAGTPEQAAAQRLPLIDAIFPGTAATYIAGSAARFHWPTAPHHKGSYCAYRVGQAAFYGSEQEPVGNLHFCGEHTSSDFQGWMEGAAESGARAASEVIASMGKKASLPLAQIVLAARMAAANRVIPGDVRARRQHLARTIRTRRCSGG
jgi:monoamine oxidase